MRAENATSVVDGNAAAGILSEIFAGDVTTARSACAADAGRSRRSPRRSSSSTRSRAIVRCRGCTHTLVTVLRTPSETRVVIGTLRELVAARA